MSVKKGSKSKGYIIRQDTKAKMPFMFNPTDQDYEREATYSVTGSPGMNYPDVQYVRGNEMTYSVELFLYSKGEKVNKTKEHIKFIKGLVPSETNSRSYKKPPEIIFCMGSFIKRCVVQKYHVHIEEWNSYGNPVHATVTLDLLQVGVK